MTDDLGLFRDTGAADDGANDDAEQPRSPQRINSRRARHRVRERRRRRVVLCTVVFVLVLAVGGVFVGVRKLQELRETPDFAGAGDAPAVIEVEDGQSLTAIGVTLVRHNVVASVRAFTLAAEADPRVLAVQPGYCWRRRRRSFSTTSRRAVSHACPVRPSF